MFAGSAASAIGAFVFWPISVRVGNPIVTLVVAAFVLTASETRLLYLTGRRDTVIITPSGAVLCAMFGLLSPPLVAVVAAISRTATQLSHQRKAPLKLTFNVASYVVASVLASAVAWPIVNGSPRGSLATLAACFGGLAVDELVSALIVSRVVALATGSQWRQLVVDGLPAWGLSTLGHGSMGLLALVLLGDGSHPIALALLLAPVTAVTVAERRFQAGARRAAITEAVSKLGRELNYSLDLEALVLVLAERTRELLQAESMAVILYDEEGSTITRVGTRQKPIVLASLPPEQRDPPSVLANLESTDTGRSYRGNRRGDPIEQHLAEDGVRELLIAPLGRGLGALQVANRLGAESFGEPDLALLNLIAEVAAGPLGFAKAYALERASTQRLRDLDRMKSDFVASVSHELRTPLTLIHGFNIALEHHRKMDPEQVDDYLARVRRNSVRLGELIDSLLSTSQLDDPPVEDDQTLDLAQAVTRVVAEMSDRGQGREVGLDLDEGTPRVLAAPDRVGLILRNLVDNALRYTEGPITVRVGNQNGHAFLAVVDSGPGIPADQQVAVFDRFYQIDQTSTRKVGGTGLGLYLVKQLCEAINARVQLESSPDTGSVFRVDFDRPAA